MARPCQQHQPSIARFIAAKRSAPARSQAATQASKAAGVDAAHRRDVPLVVGLKLVAHPLLVVAAGRAAIALGLPMDPFAATVLALVAALLAASNVPTLAERFGADSGRTARIVLLTTALAFLSFTAVVALLG